MNRFLKTGLGACGILALLASAAPAMAQNLTQEEANYFKIDAGIAMPMDVSISRPGIADADLSLKEGYRADLVLGYKFSQNLALELEGGVVFSELDKVKSGDAEFSADGDLWQVPLLASLTYTLFPNSALQPYVGAGAGGIYTTLVSDEVEDNDLTLAYQLQAGVDLKLGDNLKVGVAYKFLGTLDQKFDDMETDAIYTHAILGVLTFRF